MAENRKSKAKGKMQVRTTRAFPLLPTLFKDQGANPILEI